MVNLSFHFTADCDSIKTAILEDNSKYVMPKSNCAVLDICDEENKLGGLVLVIALQ